MNTHYPSYKTFLEEKKGKEAGLFLERLKDAYPKLLEGTFKNDGFYLGKARVSEIIEHLFHAHQALQHLPPGGEPLTPYTHLFSNKAITNYIEALAEAVRQTQLTSTDTPLLLLDRYFGRHDYSQTEYVIPESLHRELFHLYNPNNMGPFLKRWNDIWRVWQNIASRLGEKSVRDCTIVPHMLNLPSELP
ncbi:MAG: hypothetical protein GXN92_03690 [Candidatus Micrarchaeota archaeon]|nr:hypothetical protein [Candidatus Micrarchaeota archaeon]